MDLYEELKTYESKELLKYCKDGTLDMRQVTSRKAVVDLYNRKINALSKQLNNAKKENTSLRRRINKNGTHNEQCNSQEKSEPEEVNECLICADTMCGSASLDCCGQQMCIPCFAKHARQTNTCPFCRAEFGSKIKKPNILPLQGIDSMANDTTLDMFQKGHFRKIIRTLDFAYSQSTKEYILAKMVNQTSIVYMEQVKDWYDQEFDH